MRAPPGGGKRPQRPEGGESIGGRPFIRPRPSRRRGAVLAGVVLAHLGLAAGLIDAMHRPAPRRAVASAVARPAIVWWHPVPPPPRAVDTSPRVADAPVARDRLPPRRALAPPEPAAPSDAAVREPTPQPITAPAGVAATPGALPVPPSPPASRPLDLRLRPAPEGPAALARHDARLPHPPDADTRLARALGTDTRLTEQAMADGLRLRRGRDCVDLNPTRASALDGFNASVRPVPRLASAC